MRARRAFSFSVYTIVLWALGSTSLYAAKDTRRAECIWPLALQGTRLRHPNLPGVTHDPAFLRSAKFGFFNTAKTTFADLFPYDDRFIETLVMGNLLYETDGRKVFGRKGSSEPVWNASLKLLNFISARLAKHPDSQVANLYERKEGRLRCLPLSKSFSLETPREHPLAILGRILPDDVLLLELDPQPVLVAGFVAFPSNWSLKNNLGLSLSQIHAYVHEGEPEGDLKEKYRKQIEMIGRLFGPDTLGLPRQRNNWFVYSDPRVAQYPDRTAFRAPEITAKNAGTNLYLRMEREVFLTFKSQGRRYLAMFLRPFQYRLEEVARYPEVASRLVEGLHDPVNAYRGDGYNQIVEAYLREKLPWHFGSSLQ
ncbi:MAG: DUF3445 domain-containing protein [Bdellovibrionota bacterium]